jgi:hypothetical protein
MNKNILKIPNYLRQNMHSLLVYTTCKGEYIKMAPSVIHIGSY